MRTTTLQYDSTHDIPIAGMGQFSPFSDAEKTSAQRPYAAVVFDAFYQALSPESPTPQSLAFAVEQLYNGRDFLRIDTAQGLEYLSQARTQATQVASELVKRYESALAGMVNWSAQQDPAVYDAHQQVYDANRGTRLATRTVNDALKMLEAYLTAPEVTEMAVQRQHAGLQKIIC